MTVLKRPLPGRRKLQGMSSDYDEFRQQQQGPPDWTGLIVAASLSPVFLFFLYLGKAELGFTVLIVLGCVAIAIRLRWGLRRHAWFWLTIALIVVLHIPFLSFVRWPHTNIPTIAFSLPFAMAEFLLISGAISLAEKLFSKNPSSGKEDG